MFAEDAMESEELGEDPWRYLESPIHENGGRLPQHLQIGLSRQDDYCIVLVDDKVVSRSSSRPIPGQSDVSYRPFGR